MAEPVVAQKSPYGVEVEEGKSYLWCACGRSEKQPFCDGISHKETGIKPQRFTAEASKKVWLCGCKQTGAAPFCNGAHNKL